MLTQVVNSVGKHKIPRYIYHMTCKSNYKSMLCDGFIKTSNDNLWPKGIYTTELTNFFKHWRKNKLNCSLQEELLDKVAKGNEDIVILKIPTAKLDSEKLVVRSQNKLFDWFCSGKMNDACSEFKKVCKQLSKGDIDKRREALKDIIAKQESEAFAEHIIYGTPAKKANLFKQRKEAIEYIYLDDIPLTQAEKIGEVNIEELKKTNEFDFCRPIRSIFMRLLRGTPEVKGAEFLNC